MARLRSVSSSLLISVCLLALFLSFPSCGGSGSSGGGGGGGSAPGTPSGLTVAPGNAQVLLAWISATSATSYNVKRATTSGGPYTKVGSSAVSTYRDSSLTNGTTYYYVVSAVNANGESGNSAEASGTPLAPPAVPSGLTATPGNSQVSLTWSAVATASSYNVKRGTTSGGPYTTIASPTSASDTDGIVTNGTTYYYVVSAVNVGGESANSSQVSAMPSGPSTSVAVTIDVLANRHTISPYVYGGAFPEDASKITDSGLTVVRWGGNGASTYNWELGTDNADNDWYFEDFAFGALDDATDSDSAQFIKDVKAAGGFPLMTMVMLPWVAQSPETSSQQGNGSPNYHWSYSVLKYGAQCGSDPYNNDAGNGLKPDCSTPITADPNDAYFPLLDTPGTGDPANSVYRSQWVTDPTKGLAQAFGSGTCKVPYSSITSCHFYDMDNEIDIWGGTHRDIHPNPSGYDELATTYVTAANNLKGWDPQAVRLGPVSCCWWFYWNGANGNDKGAHAGIDFLPWWLNQVYWQDQISNTRSLDMFDIHAYPDGPDMSNYTTAQKQAAAVSIYRDYWDPTLTSPSGTVNQIYTTSIQPNHAIAFRIPRMRAIVNSIYPNTPLAMTEWSAEFAGAGDFSTALGDADAYGLLGRERVSLSTRWTAPISTNPNYQALKLYTRYDGTHGFGTTSVAASHNANPNLFSTYAALNSSGTVMTIMVLNKDPGNATQATFTFAGNGFTPTNVTSYTLSQNSPTSIVVGSSQAWSATQWFAPYTATLLVVSGNLTNGAPGAEWDLNPDTIMVPASGTVTLNPIITSGTGTVSLANAVFDAYEGATMCSGSLNITTAAITSTGNGAIQVNAGSTPGFCHFTVTGTDSAGATQTQGGWIVVGKPPATLAPTSGNRSGSTGSQLTVVATLSAGQSGGTNTGASVLFSTTAGTLSNGTISGHKVIAVTNSSGAASVTLTLPTSAGPVTVTAEGPYGLGHPVATFTETAQ